MFASGSAPSSAPGGEAPVPELFDIHVMYFVGDPRHIARELSIAFRIHPDAGLRIATEAPITVKRAATPELAQQYLEVLVQLGAQVILLPTTRSSTVPAEPLPPAPPKSTPPGMTQAARDERTRVDDGRRVARGLFGEGPADLGRRPSARPPSPASAPAPAAAPPPAPPPASRSVRPSAPVDDAPVISERAMHLLSAAPPAELEPGFSLFEDGEAELTGFDETQALPEAPPSSPSPAGLPTARASEAPPRPLSSPPSMPESLPKPPGLPVDLPAWLSESREESQLSMVSKVFGALAEQEAASFRPPKPKVEEDVGAFGISFDDTPEAKFIDLPLPTPGFAPSAAPPPPPPPPKAPATPTMHESAPVATQRKQLQAHEIGEILGQLGLLVDAPPVVASGEEGAAANATLLTSSAVVAPSASGSGAPAAPTLMGAPAPNTSRASGAPAAPTLMSAPAPSPSGTSAADDSTPPALMMGPEDSSVGGSEMLDLGGAIGSLPAPSDDDLWRPVTEHGVEAPTASDRKVGSGLFMAAEADEFVGVGQISGAPPDFSGMDSFLPSERPRSLPPLPPTSVRPAGSPVSIAPPRVPPAAASRASQPAPPPPPAPAAPIVSRMPPRMLGLELDKVPPLPGVDAGRLGSRAEERSQSRFDPSSKAAVDAGEDLLLVDTAASGNREVDPGDLTSLPAIDIQGGHAPRSLPAPPEPPPLKVQGGPLPAPGGARPAPLLTSPLNPAGQGANRAPAGAPRQRLQLPTRKIGYAFGLLGCAGAIGSLGVMLDNSPLYGNATLPSVLLHAFALYAVGAAVLGVAKS